MKRNFLIIVIVVVVLSIAGVAYAQEALTPDETQSAESEGELRQRQPKFRGKHKGPLAGLMKGMFRGKLLVDTPEGVMAVRIDRGDVVEVTEDNIKIEEKDGKVVNITIDDDTRIVGKQLDEIKAGDKIQSIRTKKDGDDSYSTKVIMAGKHNKDRSPRSNDQERPIRPPLEGDIF